MYNSKRFETVKNIRENKKISNVVQAAIGVLAVVLAALIVWMMVLVSGIQGTARVVNYAGLVRGETQRLVKMEIAGQAEDGMMESVESFINGLRFGDDELTLVRLGDKSFQTKMEELASCFESLKQEIYLVREKGFEKTDIIDKSEKFFDICDEATGLAETYSQKRASSLAVLERYITADIVVLMLLIGYEFIKALHYTAMNHALQKKVYMDEATGLPNKNKCEELLSAPEMITMPVGVCSFDLNNLRRINNSMGHEKGDAYIRIFAELVREAVPAHYFVGRAGGDEFIAIMNGADKEEMQRCLQLIRDRVDTYNAANPDFPVSYAVGISVSDENENCTMRDLYIFADKNMYINKNHVKREEALAEKKLDRRLLKSMKKYGSNFSDCLYCDARQDAYRVIRASEAFFLAADGSYSGAVEQIAEERVAQEDRKAVRSRLQLTALCEALSEKNRVVELQHKIFGENSADYGRLTAIFVDADPDGTLHHFLLAFETIDSVQPETDAKQQLTQYYEQLKQSILENDSYVDAMLETADAVYSVNLTNDLVERDFRRERGADTFIEDLKAPCPYGEYCHRHSMLILPETMGSYRLIDTAEKLLERYASGEKQVTVEYCERVSGSETRWIQKTALMMSSRVYDAKSGEEKPMIHSLVLLKNTTEFHAQEQKEHERLRAEVDEATLANKAKTEFLSRMSHDIRTPINGVMGMLEIIKKNREDHERVDDCLEKIHVSSEHLLSLINDVLDMSKLESGHMEPEHVPFDLDDLMKNVRALNEAQVAKTSIVYTYSKISFAHAKLIGSPLHLRQILLNLFSNAAKYNKENGTIETHAEEIACDENTATFRFTIRDTGIGMSEDFVNNELFEPFTQEKQGARTQYQGTGLGMSIVKELIEKMNGTITVESVLGEGSAFTVTLPFEIDKHPSAQAAANGAADETALHGLKVLLAEDNELNMEIAEFFLEDMGAETMQAWNGKEAVEAFRNSAPGEIGVILMDIMMPVMDGLEAVQRIRALDRPDAKTVPIIAMTANAFSEDVERSRKAGMTEHLSKPLNAETLKKAILRNI